MITKIVFFDLDNTLFTQQNYTKLKVGWKSNFVLLKPHIYAELFKLLLKHNFKIGFITTASYTKAFIIPLLEHIYGLARGTLDPNLYYNAVDLFAHNFIKAKKINYLKTQQILSPDAFVLLIDDTKEQIACARYFGIPSIQATANFKITNNLQYFSYINKVIHNYLVGGNQAVQKFFQDNAKALAIHSCNDFLVADKTKSLTEKSSSKINHSPQKEILTSNKSQSYIRKHTPKKNKPKWKKKVNKFTTNITLKL